MLKTNTKIIFNGIVAILSLLLIFCYNCEKNSLKIEIQKEQSRVVDLTNEGNLLREYNSELENENKNILEEKEKLIQQLNELNEKYQKEIKEVSFNEWNVLSSSYVTENKLKRILNNTALSGLEASYVESEKKYGVNAIFLLAITIEESGWGTSYIANKNNNICGIKSGGKWRYFSSKEECIDYQANLLKNQYLTKGGRYYNGVSVEAVNIFYCEGNKWSSKIIALANEIVNKINRK